jgi:hypothetical protein
MAKLRLPIMLLLSTETISRAAIMYNSIVICGSPNLYPTPQKMSTPLSTPESAVTFSRVRESQMVLNGIFWVQCDQISIFLSTLRITSRCFFCAFGFNCKVREMESILTHFGCLGQFMLFMSIHVNSCQFMLFMSFNANSTQYMSFILIHDIYVNSSHSCHSCQFMSFMSIHVNSCH